MKVKLEKGAIFERQEIQDAGYDMCNAGEDTTIPPYTSAIISTGVSVDLPTGYYGDLTHRSSLAWKKNCIISRGIIDPSYKGTIKAKVFNLGGTKATIKKGERFAQLLLIPYNSPMLTIVDDIGSGKDGFGSSGAF